MCADRSTSDEQSDGISNWKKLKLLLWKNWILQWNQKLQFILALLLPVFFLLLIILLRALVKTSAQPETRYPALSIDDLNLFHSSVILGNRIVHENGTLNYPKQVLCYTPDSTVNRAIVIKTVVQLRLFGWRAYDTSQHMEYDLVKHNYFVGVVFQPAKESDMIKGFPLIFNYSLRFPSELRTVRSPIIDNWHTNSLFPGYDHIGPRNRNASDGGVPVGYLAEGFIPVQHALTMSWLQMAGAKDYLPKVMLRRFPYNPYIYDPLLSGLQQLLPFMLLLSFIYPCSFVAKYVTSEKELQLKEIMKLLGLHNWLHWVAWFVKSYILLMIVVIMLVCLLLGKFYASVAVLTYTNWMPLLLFLHSYVVASICFCFMLAVFFTKASTAAAVTGILWFLTYIPYSFSYYYYERMSLSAKLILCVLFSNTALGFGIHVIMSWEGTGEGAQWENVIKRVSPDDTLALFDVILMLTVAGLWYMAVCLYVEQIFPGKYGVPQPWYYPVSKKFWFSLLGPSSVIGNEAQLTNNSRSSHSQAANVISDHGENLRVGIQLCNLEKRYRKHVALHNLTLNIYRDEITVLLGHNGAGKTTTILMLTGIIPPSSGTAMINGWDLRTQLESVRRSLGFCPQHNILFDDMSVRNHIVFFSSLKGIHGEELQREVYKYVQIMQLEDKMHVAAAKLSGGMKRKLSLCCALCGNTKTVLCDEPSSGLDAAARRCLWDLLRAEKAGRTVLLTTHYMDEADVLGDRIVILSNGQLQCYGTPFYLKKRFGDGYRLICIKQRECIAKKITSLLDKYMPGIALESELGTELAYRLPSSHLHRYADILSELEEQGESLHIDGYGLSMASMEEVFMRAGIEQQRNVGGADEVVLQNSSLFMMNYYKLSLADKKNVIFDSSMCESHFGALCLLRWEALFSKKCLITKRNIWVLIIQLAIPIIFMVLTILNSRGGRIYYMLPPMYISLRQYPRSFVVLEDQSGEKTGSLADTYTDYVVSQGATLLNTSGMGFENYILKASEEQRARVDAKYLAGVTIEEGNITVWFNNKPFHTAPLALNLLHNALARQVLGPESGTGVTNDPLPYSNDTLTMRLNKGQRLGAEIAINLCLCMCFVTAFFVIPIINERTTRAKLLQYLTGVEVFVYWITHLIWDYAIFFATALLAMITIAAFREIGYSSFLDLGRYLVLLLVFGCAALPLSYVLSNCFTDGATGFTRIGIMCILTGAGLFALVVALSFEKFQLKYLADIVVWYFRVFPHFCLANGLHHIHIGFNIRRGCSIPAIKKLPQSEICRNIPVCCNIPGYFAWRTPGILPELVYLIATAICLFALLLFIDSRKCSQLYELLIKCYDCLHCRKSNREEGGEFLKQEDEDVQMERSKIARLVSQQRISLPLVVDGISKRYGRHIAVRNLSFRVEPAECFGLLGINGAGKTSTFKMLTGDVKISKGVAYVDGINLRTHMHKVYHRIGYCPQFDALLEDLSGRETLRIFCMLRGVQRRHIKTMSDGLATAFGFIQHMDKPVRCYSGGNKRKLSAALALIGNPSVLYLDEPSSGMDPAARRRLWNMLAYVRELGKSIVLTSHSMDECEALCTRIAIMVDGEIKCMGSTQYLRNKFSKGFILKIKIKSSSSILQQDPDSTETNNDRSDSVDEINIANANTNNDRIKKFINQNIADALLQEEHQNVLTFFIPTQSIRLSKLFQLIENNNKELNIEDYIITQSTLEEIFLEFATLKKK
ncbi:ATP-binding cassette sub-family A member 3 [Scaptodrosophila lebanonensis]|uniref:ATP-binding cassette sub-family A member 3 n=1 Tax=Drosophila lebanonensis TaxID=7225 RepID=A0A6J2TGX0_DROLE|nr:ATP-binding cassette sub-family A member 3 [Scaptodrosophila lebanonensis]